VATCYFLELVLNLLIAAAFRNNTIYEFCVLEVIKSEAGRLWNRERLFLLSKYLVFVRSAKEKVLYLRSLRVFPLFISLDTSVQQRKH